MARNWSRAEEDRIIALIRLCRDPRQLRQIQAQTLVNGQSHNNFLLAKLVRTFMEFGNLHHARVLAESVSNPNVFLWTSVIRGYSQNSTSDDLCGEALILYAKMHRSGSIQPMNFTLSSVLKSCSRVLDLNYGLQVHAHVVKFGFGFETQVQTTLIDLYGKCGRMVEAHQLFDRMPVSGRDVQAWNTMISRYVEAGRMDDAVKLFEKMPERNSFTWVEIVTGYANCGKMDVARELLDKGMLLAQEGRDAIVVCTAMISGYVKCGDIFAARSLFDEMSERDVAAWNAMIGAYSQMGLFDEAIYLFRLMLRNGGKGQVKPNHTTMSIVISACTHVGSIEVATWIEEYINSRGCELMNNHTVAALIDMHAKCGDLDKAHNVFINCKDKDVVCYSTMIAGFGIHGHGLEALQVFCQLQEEGLRPDRICFVGVLSACSHAGLVDEGYSCFQSMKEDYSITLTADHYMCLVDLLGRAGRIQEAYRVITSEMPPVEPHAGVWGALLSACRLHCNVDVGEEAGRHLMELEPENAGNYVLLSNMYAKARMWGDVANIRSLMRRWVTRKPPGCSWIEVDGEVRRFLTGDAWDCQLEKMMEVLARELKVLGYCQTADYEH